MRSIRNAALPKSLLRVSELTVGLHLDSGETVFPVRGVTFGIAERQAVGILGESGAGKSTLALALLQLLPRSFRTTAGSIQFRNRELIALPEDSWREIRGKHIAIVHQHSDILNPFLRVGEQVAEVLRAHHEWLNQRCLDEAAQTFEQVGLGHEASTFRAYPHQLSGGQRQRVCIALAIACAPALLIADEPTASLDAVTAAEMLRVFAVLKGQHRTSFLLISHEPAVLASLTDYVLVMYAGEIVESGPTRQVFQSPMHPYTRELLRCAPREKALDPSGGKPRWPFIPGTPADLGGTAYKCPFESRCPDRMEICGMCPPAETVPVPSRTLRCFVDGGGR